MIVGNIENGLEHGFVEHCLNYVLIIDPMSPLPSETLPSRVAKPNRNGLESNLFRWISTEMSVIIIQE